jgi:hypothetical protein
MFSIVIFTALLLAAGVTQAILTLCGRRYAADYCVMNRRDDDAAAGVIVEDDLH